MKRPLTTAELYREIANNYLLAFWNSTGAKSCGLVDLIQDRGSKTSTQLFLKGPHDQKYMGPNERVFNFFRNSSSNDAKTGSLARLEEFLVSNGVPYHSFRLEKIKLYEASLQSIWRALYCFKELVESGNYRWTKFIYISAAGLTNCALHPYLLSSVLRRNYGVTVCTISDEGVITPIEQIPATVLQRRY